MRRKLGAGLLGLALLGAPPVALADDVEGEAAAAIEAVTEEEGGNQNWILAAILAVVVIGGGIALSRRGSS